MIWGMFWVTLHLELWITGLSGPLIIFLTRDSDFGIWLVDCENYIFVQVFLEDIVSTRIHIWNNVIVSIEERAFFYPSFLFYNFSLLKLLCFLWPGLSSLISFIIRIITQWRDQLTANTVLRQTGTLAVTKERDNAKITGKLR